MRLPNQILTACAVVALIAFGSTADAQVSTDHHLRVENQTLPLDGSVTLSVRYDLTGTSVQGWSFGLCHDTSLLELGEISTGATTNIVRNGDPAEFIDIREHVGGWTTGVLVCFTGCASLGIGADYELYNVEYREIGGTPTSTDICFCDNLGAPVVETLVVVAGLSVIPSTTCGRIDIVDLPAFNASVSYTEGEYSPLDGTGEALVELSLAEDLTVGGGLMVEAFSLGLAHDETQLVATNVAPVGIIAAVNGFTGPDFFGPNLLPDGMTIGTLFSFSTAETLSFAIESPVVRVDYETIPGAFLGNEIGVTTVVEFRDDLGVPPVPNVAVVAGSNYPIGLSLGAIQLEAVLGTPFQRGDCNNDGSPNIADGVWLLNYLFVGGPASLCLAACDTDGDQELGLLDAVLFLNHWISGGPPPAAPYPGCGVDPAADCPEYAACAD